MSKAIRQPSARIPAPSRSRKTVRKPRSLRGSAAGLRLILAGLLLLLWTPAPASADFCDTIDDLANSWAEVADALEQTAGEDIGDLDVPRLERDVDQLLDPTETLGDALIALGNAEEEEMGQILLDLTGELYDVTDDDLAAYLVDRIDDIVDGIDNVVDYCDAGGE